MEKFDDEFGDLSGYKILSFEEVTQGFEGNKNPLQGIAIKSFEEISREKWAKMRGENIEDTVILEDFFEDEINNISQLIDDLKSSDYFVINKFDSRRYINHKEILNQFKKDSGLPPFAEKDKLRIRENNYLLEVKPKKTDSKELQKISDDLFFNTLKKHINLNTSIDYIDKKEYTHNITINIGTDIKSVLYQFHIYYSQVKFTDTGQHPTSTETLVNTDDKYKAIVLRTESYQTFMEFIKRIYGVETYKKYQYILFERFEKLATEIDTIEELKFFYDSIPDFVFEGFQRNGKTIKLSDNILWNHFMKFIEYDDSITSEDKKNGVMWSLPAQDFRDEGSYAIKILSGISGDFILGKLLPDPELVLRIYSNLDGQSEYKGKAFLINGASNSYGSWIDNKTIFVSIITAHLQNYEQDSRVQFTQNKETDFFQGTDLVDQETNYQIEYALDSHIFFKEAGEHRNTIYLKNEMREWIPYGTLDTNRGTETVGEWTGWTDLAEAYYNPLEMVTFSQYIDRKDLEGNLSEDCIISNVPALFVKHASDLKEWQKVHQMIRIGADILMIVGSISTIASGASGLILYAALADLGLATADIGIQSIKPELEKLPEGREFLEQWEILYTVGTTVTIGPLVLKAIEKKLPQILEKAVPLFHTNKLWGKTYEAFSNIVLKSVYSLRINGFTKSGLQLIKYNQCITELGSLFRKAYRLQDAGVLFVKNVKGQASAIYKGFVLKAGSKEEVGNFIERVLKKAGRGKKLEQELDKLVKELEHAGGNNFGASIVETTDAVKIKAFEEGLKQFSKTIAKPFDKIKDAMPYFNHYSVGNALKQVDTTNCGNVVDVIIEFLKTGRLRLAETSGFQSFEKIIEKCGGGHFQPTTIPRMKQLMAEEEIVIIYGVKEKNSITGSTIGHYFVGVKKGGELHLFDGQTGEYVVFAQTREYGNFIQRGYLEFKYTKVRK